MDTKPRRISKIKLDLAIADYFIFFNDHNIPVGEELCKLSFRDVVRYVDSELYLDRLGRSLAKLLQLSPLWERGGPLSRPDLVRFAMAHVICLHPKTTLRLGEVSFEDYPLYLSARSCSKRLCDVSVMIMASPNLKEIDIEQVNGFVIHLVQYFVNYDAWSRSRCRRRRVYIVTMLYALYKLYRAKGHTWRGRARTQKLIRKFEEELERIRGFNTVRCVQNCFVEMMFQSETLSRYA